MVCVLQKVCCTTLQSHLTKKHIPSYIREFLKQFLKNATQTMKSLLTFQPTKTILNFLLNIRPIKQNSLIQTYQGKSKEDATPTIPFPEDVTCA